MAMDIIKWMVFGEYRGTKSWLTHGGCRGWLTLVGWIWAWYSKLHVLSKYVSHLFQIPNCSIKSHRTNLAGSLVLGLCQSIVAYAPKICRVKQSYISTSWWHQRINTMSGFATTCLDWWRWIPMDLCYDSCSYSCISTRLWVVLWPESRTSLE